MQVYPSRLVKLALAWMVAAFALSGCGGSPAMPTSQPAQSGETPAPAAATITISGAFALYPMVVRWAEEYKAAYPEVQFDISAGGAGKGMSDVLAGAVDVAMVSREIRQEEADQGATGFAVAKDAVLATVNANNPVLDQLLVVGLTPAHGAEVWINGTITTWGQLVGTDNADRISVYTRSDSSGAGEMWAIFLGGKAQEDLQQGTNIAVQGDPGLAEAVRQDPLGIGYNNLNFAYDAATGRPIEGLRVIPLDLNGDGKIADDEDFYADKASLTAAIADGGYPSPPARALYLVTKGAPSDTVAAFIRWVLTDGQAFVDETGYVQLAEAQLQASLTALGE
ncbi:MAG: phosphate ABC transporter substrate-binding protein PstS [Anaerolineae bacterium]